MFARYATTWLRAGTEILSSYVALTWPQFASSSLAVPKNSAAQQAAEAAQRCPTCNTQLVLRETLRNFTAAPQGYYCDGCSAVRGDLRFPIRNSPEAHVCVTGRPWVPLPKEWLRLGPLCGLFQWVCRTWRIFSDGIWICM